MSKEKYFFCDAHCHLNNPLFKNDPFLWDQLNALGFRFFMNSALMKEDLQYQVTPLKQSSSAGLHPYLFKQQDFDIDDLENLCQTKSIKAIGEIGIDKRFDNLKEQEELLIEQLLLAKKYHLPVVFHCVKSYDQLSSLCRTYYPDLFGYIHGFNATIDQISLFKDLNIVFSINYKFLNKKNALLIAEYLIDNNKLLIETDIELKLFDHSSSIIDVYRQSHEMIKLFCKNDSNLINKLAYIQYKILKSFSLI